MNSDIGRRVVQNDWKTLAARLPAELNLILGDNALFDDSVRGRGNPRTLLDSLAL
jgi:hypothetical protein